MNAGIGEEPAAQTAVHLPGDLQVHAVEATSPSPAGTDAPIASMRAMARRPTSRARRNRTRSRHGVDYTGGVSYRLVHQASMITSWAMAVSMLDAGRG